jgi:hypothetical protein
LRSRDGCGCGCWCWCDWCDWRAAVGNCSCDTRSCIDDGDDDSGEGETDRERERPSTSDAADAEVFNVRCVRRADGDEAREMSGLTTADGDSELTTDAAGWSCCWYCCCWWCGDACLGAGDAKAEAGAGDEPRVP